MGGCFVLEWVKARALDKLVPQGQLSVIASRLEVSDCGRKLLWVKAQMEHARAARQAQQVTAALAPKWYRDGDVHMGEVLQDAASRTANSWHLRGQCAKLAAGGDWEGVVNVLIGAVMRWDVVSV